MFIQKLNTKMKVKYEYSSEDFLRHLKMRRIGEEMKKKNRKERGGQRKEGKTRGSQKQGP